MNNRGIALIICYMVIVVLTVLGAALLVRSISEKNVTDKYFDTTQAFWLAEAGISRARYDFNANGSFQTISATALGPGGYNVEVVSPAKVRSHGFVPFATPYKAERSIELNLPFYSTAIYAAGNLNISGGAYSVTGDVIYAGTGPAPSPNEPENIQGTVTHDPSINPLDLLSFDQLKIISQNQGNYNSPYLPASYWFDAVQGIPNVVYLDGDLTLKGNDNVHGFFVVGGAAIYDATLQGNVSVDGCIYTRGDFTVQGGGNALNISGAVWSGGDTNLNGSVTIEYNSAYVAGLLQLGINPNYKIIWREADNPF